MFTHHKQNIITSEGPTTIHYKIEWEKGDLVERHDHEVHYAASGYDSINELEFEGTWIVIDNHFDEIVDINCITDSNIDI